MNEQTFNVGDYVETNTGDRGTIQTIELNLTNGQYIANVAFDGGTNIHWLIRDLILVTKAGDYGTMDTHLLDSIPEAEVWTNGGTLYLDEHVEHDLRDAYGDWQYEVANGDTLLGFTEWKARNVEATNIDRDFEVSISNTFSAEGEQEAVGMFIEWSQQSGLTYEVREVNGNGEYSNPVYVEAVD